MRLAQLLAPFLLVTCSSLAGQTQYCPGCYTQQSDPLPAPQSGLGTDPSGNPYINVCIDSSWYVGTGSNPGCSDPANDTSTSAPSTPGTTNSNVWNAVSGAVTNWNSAKNSSGGIVYHFVFSGSDCSNADIIVKRTTNPQSIGGCGEEDGSISNNSLISATIQLSDCSAQSGASNTLGTVEHELGHWLGLAELGSQNCKSAMGGYTGACNNNVAAGTGTITSNDVSETVAYAAGDTKCTTDNNKDQESCDQSQDPNCPIPCSENAPSCSDGSQAQCVNNVWACDAGWPDRSFVPVSLLV
jgi:hypothetical protein